MEVLRTRNGSRAPSRPVRYALRALVLASGAPLGLLGLRSALRATLPSTGWIVEEVSGDLPLYCYVFFATALVMALAGFHMGRYEDALASLSDTDALTLLPNRRGFDTSLARELSRARRQGTPLTLLLIDVDRFKQVNDAHGHAAGDAALQEVARALRETSRRVDTPARHGGDEFALLLPGATAAEGQLIAGRLRVRSREAPPFALGAKPLTLSIGIAELTPADDSSGGRFVLRADEALYQAKDQGRDRSVIWQSR